MKIFNRNTSLAAMIMASTAMSSVAFADDSKPGEGVTVQPIVGLIAEEQFQARILFRGLEDLGYTIAEPEEVEIQTAHMALGTGDGDFYPAHWETLQSAFFEESGGDSVLTKVGPYIEGALQGYLIDKATYDSGVTDISQLADPEVAAKFDSDGDGKADLAGCVPGWGCERVIEHQLTEYGLRDTVTHNQGAYNAIIGDTIARYETGEPVLYYTWMPYWVSGVLVPGQDVEFLSVPYTSLPDGAEANTEFNGKNIGFAPDNIYILATNDFLEANPAAAEFLKAARLDVNDVSAQNKLMADGADSSDDIDQQVSDWISAHQDEYDAWLQAARSAAM